MHSTDDNEIFDITILGGGPTGLFAAFYAGLRNAKCKIIDSMPLLGGRLSAVYPEKYIYDVAGFPKILAQELVDNLTAQIAPYKPTICLNETAESLTQTQDLWQIKTNKGTHLTRTLLISAGVGSYSPKKHQAPGADIFLERGIEYAVLEKNKYKGKRVVILGGGDSALDWANELVAIAASVTLVHRSESFRAHDDSINKLQNTTATIILNTEVVAFSGKEHLESVTLKNNLSEETYLLPVDSALIMFGFNSSLGKIKEWGLSLQKDAILVNEKMETNLPGVFAAGDITEYSSKLKLIVTGFSEAAIAVAFAKVFINPKEKAQPLHSTTIMEIKEKKEKLLQKNS